MSIAVATWFGAQRWFGTEFTFFSQVSQSRHLGHEGVFGHVEEVIKRGFEKETEVEM